MTGVIPLNPHMPGRNVTLFPEKKASIHTVMFQLRAGKMYIIVGMNINVHTKDHGQSTVRSPTNAVRADREHARRRIVAPVHTIKAYSESGGISPLILNLDARWK